MLRSLWESILGLFKIDLSTKQKEQLNKNVDYAKMYEDAQNINYTAIISNKLTKYTIYESVIGIEGQSPRNVALNDVLERLWKDKNSLVSQAYGVGGVVLYPYIKDGVVEFSIINQSRLSINATSNGKITNATLLADKVIINNSNYYLWIDMKIENGNLTYVQRATKETSNVSLSTVSKWANLKEEQTISNVDRVPVGYIKSPIYNRETMSFYGVPVTYGTEKTIAEILDLHKKIYDEFDIKQSFLGIDERMLRKDENGKIINDSKKYRKFKTDKDNYHMFEIFSPDIRDSSYYARLTELYERLEKEIGLSRGILSEMPSFTTATQFKKALFDTTQVIGDMRDNIKAGIEDFIYACNVLMSFSNANADSEYELQVEWSYLMLEDYQQIFSNDITMMNAGLKSKAEVRAYQTGETVEEAQEKIDEIASSEPTTKDLLGM